MKKNNKPLTFFMSVCLVLFLLAGALMTACTAPTPAPAPTPTPTPTPTPPPAPAEVIELKLSYHFPPVAPLAKAIDEWAKKLEENTNGGVKVTIFPSGALASGRDAFPSTAGGVCDIAWVPGMYQSSNWSLNNIVGLTSLPIPRDARGNEIWDKLWEKYPVMLDEFEGVKVLFKIVTMPTSLNTKKAVRVPDDIKGMKIAGMGDSLTLLKAAGASPVGMGSNDWYMSLEKGVIEGCLAPVGVLTDRGVEKLTPNHVDMGIGQGGNIMIINLERWNSFPPDIKAKFEELNSWAADIALKANEDLITNAWKKCADQNIVKPTAEEKKLWLACAQPSTDDWIEKNASKGPTAEMVEYTLKLIEEMK